MQAADALSLADGPCKLTCADFFREMTEQAQGLEGFLVFLLGFRVCFELGVFKVFWVCLWVL